MATVDDGAPLSTRKRVKVCSARSHSLYMETRRRRGRVPWTRNREEKEKEEESSSFRGRWGASEVDLGVKVMFNVCLCKCEVLLVVEVKIGFVGKCHCWMHLDKKKSHTPVRYKTALSIDKNAIPFLVLLTSEKQALQTQRNYLKSVIAHYLSASL